MTEFERFDQNARSKGVFVDTNLLVLVIVGSVNPERISNFKRTAGYSAVDWELIMGIWTQIPRLFTVPHVLAEVSALTDLKGPELDLARSVLEKTIGLLEEVPVASADACSSPLYRRLGLTDAAVAVAARQLGCSVITNDAALYSALLGEGRVVVKFDRLRELL